ncbi:cytochrome c [Gluconacetobacter tumulicola]|uniref:Cytochrome c n=2 Tax=Gluconacetobacter tumulicola TaxID=1017177 RepID=A0A7W4JER3_9PROT|nr:cytochrome c [Gluconacetobacter tumulicola]
MSGAACLDGRAHARAPASVDPKLVEHGAYVAILGDCVACHTAQDDRPYAGGLPIASPLGTIYSTNITPDPDTGIGTYSYDDFERAVRRGIRKDGKTLYPAMPYPDFSRISDGDMHALYAFFMSGLKPAHAPNKAAGISWPLSMRWPLAWWRWVFVPKVQPAVASTDGDALADRGAYLVEGPGHCGTCHTPRGMALQQKALSPRDGTAFLAGGQIDNYTANTLRGDDLSGLGSWNEEDIVRFLKSGRNRHAAVFGGMADVVFQSTQHMSDADLQAIAHFLKTIPATKAGPAFTYNPAAAQELFAGNVSRRGARTYIDNCAACHRTSGKGYDDTFPALANNPVVNAADPSSLLHLVLIGGTIPSTVSEPTHFAMPPFGDRLSDQEIADVVTFIRSNWGNQASAINTEDVAKFRRLIAPSPVKKTL